MPRPPPPPHLIQPFLQLLRDEHHVKLGQGTEKKYLAILRRMEDSGETPAAWLAEKSKGASRTTIGVMRGAILYYRSWKHYEETGEVLTGPDVAEKLGRGLTPMRAGRKSQERRILTRRQYRRYTDTVTALEVSDQIKTVLLLLPLTGLRISEACGLREEDVICRGDEWVIEVVGKGQKLRRVPLGERAKELLEPYLDDPTAEGFLFPNPLLGSPGSTRPDLSPAQVRAVVREQLQVISGLEDVVPHILRHQFATTAIQSGMSLPDAKAVLGHSKMETLERYLHSTEETVREGMERVEERLSGRAKR